MSRFTAMLLLLMGTGLALRVWLVRLGWIGRHALLRRALGGAAGGTYAWMDGHADDDDADNDDLLRGGFPSCQSLDWDAPPRRRAARLPATRRSLKLVEASLDVAVPVHRAYEQWTRIEDYPRFLGGVTSVRRLNTGRLAWTAERAGVVSEWTTETCYQLQDWQLGWVCTSGPGHGGSVQFEALAPHSTRVTLRLEYEPGAAMAPGTAALAQLSQRAADDLRRFKEFIESGVVKASGLLPGDLAPARA